MKTFLSASAIIILLVFTQQISRAYKSEKFIKPIPPEVKKQTIRFDTFYAVQTIFKQKGKAIAKDTIVFIMHEIKENPTLARAGIKYSLEPLPYNSFDTVTPVKAAADTIVWTYKPYKPK